MWFILENKAPTWDTLQKRQIAGPGWCSLCKASTENVHHLFLFCPFSNAVWNESSRLLSQNFRWQGDSVVDALRNWIHNSVNCPYKALPLIICLGIVTGSEQLYFFGSAENSRFGNLPRIGHSLLFPSRKRSPCTQDNYSEEPINKQLPWDSSMGPPKECLQPAEEGVSSTSLILTALR